MTLSRAWRQLTAAAAILAFGWYLHVYHPRAAPHRSFHRGPKVEYRNPITAFVDVGGFTGDTLEQFYTMYPKLFLRETEHYRKRDHPQQPSSAAAFDEVYVFEPNPNNHANYTRLWDKGYNFNLVKAAATDRDGIVSFAGGDTGHEGDGWSIGPAADAAARGGDAPADGNDDAVVSVDFSRWLKKNFVDEDYVMCKIDCEGSEYAMLTKMMADGSLCLCDRLSVEWHAWLSDAALLAQGELDKLMIEQFNYPGSLRDRVDSSFLAAGTRDVVCAVPHLRKELPFYYCYLPRIVKSARAYCGPGMTLEKWF